MKYLPISEADIPEIISLYAKHLNEGESISASISSAWENGSYMGFIAKENGETAGFMTVRRGIAFTYPHPDLEAEIAEISKGKKIAYCDALLVLPKNREEGTAHELAAKVKEFLRNMGVELFLSEIWIYPDGTSPAQKVFESVGTVVWKERSDDFYRDLASYGMSCPICGTDCVCGAWIELMEL